MSRDFGYGGFNNDIQGLFSMKVTGPADLVRVVFYIDSDAIGEVIQAPFNLQFNTDNYPLGHTQFICCGLFFEWAAISFQCYYPQFRLIFSRKQGRTSNCDSSPGDCFRCHLAFLCRPVDCWTRGKIKNLPLGAERNYGTGGGICPKCHRPFALPLFSMNLGSF